MLSPLFQFYMFLLILTYYTCLVIDDKYSETINKIRNVKRNFYKSILGRINIFYMIKILEKLQIKITTHGTFLDISFYLFFNFFGNQNYFLSITIYQIIITTSSRLYHNDITQNVHVPPPPFLF